MKGTTAVFSQSFTYDPFGNLAKSGNDTFAANYSYSPPTNQLTSVGSDSSMQYDSDGNVLNDTVQAYTWDAYGNARSVADKGQTGVNVTYDALGRAVEQANGGAYTDIQYSPTGFKLMLFNQSSYIKAFVPMPGGTAEVFTPSVTYYRHSDWLGNVRLTSDLDQNVISDTAYAPFGETYAQTGTDTSFTGMDADTIGNDYDFPAREYGALTGRWPSPDPLGVGAVDPTDPQSWNRYAYVRNSPLGLTDPNGMDYEVCVGGDYGYASSDVPGDCEVYAGSNMTELNSELPCGLWTQGNDNYGGINGTGGCGCEGAMVGTYVYFGQGGGGGGGSSGGDGGNGGGGVGGSNGGSNGENPNGGGPINYWPEGGPKIPVGLAALILPSNCALDPTCGADSGISDLGSGKVKVPCTPLANHLQGTPAAGLDTLFDGYERLTHPLDLIYVNGVWVATGALTTAAGGGAAFISCATPEPFEPLTCAVGGTAGVATAGGGLFLLKESLTFFKKVTWPAIKNWGCHE